MADELVLTTGIARHGATRLPSVDVDSFNIELKDDEGFLGDRASKGAFRKILDRWRKPSRKSGEDRFELIGKNAMLSIFTRSNPQPIRAAGDVIEILKLAA